MANEKRLIDANDFLDLFYVASAGQDKAFVKAVEMVLEDTPTVDVVEVVHGKWINNGGHRKMDLCCSVCNRRASNFVGGYEDWWDLWFPKYCPNCGAKMDGGNEDG